LSGKQRNEEMDGCNRCANLCRVRGWGFVKVMAPPDRYECYEQNKENEGDEPVRGLMGQRIDNEQQHG
jgi:hypothetical protein